MSTLRQIEANRRNAQLSTGPRSVEGKAVTRLNALKSGIDANTYVIRGEDSAELEALTVAYFEDFRPVTSEARALVEALVLDEWLLRRMLRAETDFWNWQLDPEAHTDPRHSLGKVAHYHGDTLDRIQRRMNSIRRNTDRTLKALRNLPLTEQSQFPPQPVAPETQPTVPEPPRPVLEPVPGSESRPQYPQQPPPPAGEPPRPSEPIVIRGPI